MAAPAPRQTVGPCFSRCAAGQSVPVAGSTLLLTQMNHLWVGREGGDKKGTVKGGGGEGADDKSQSSEAP